MKYIKAKNDGYSATDKKMSKALNDLLSAMTSVTMFTEGEGQEDIQKLRQKIINRLTEDGQLKEGKVKLC